MTLAFLISFHANHATARESAPALGRKALRRRTPQIGMQFGMDVADRAPASLDTNGISEDEMKIQTTQGLVRASMIAAAVTAMLSLAACGGSGSLSQGTGGGSKGAISTGGTSGVGSGGSGGTDGSGSASSASGDSGSAGAGGTASNGSGDGSGSGSGNGGSNPTPKAANQIGNVAADAGGVVADAGSTVSDIGGVIGSQTLPGVGNGTTQATGAVVSDLGTAVSTLGNGVAQGLGQLGASTDPVGTTASSVGVSSSR
jgi:hypothetical protein